MLAEVLMFKHRVIDASFIFNTDRNHAELKWSGVIYTLAESCAAMVDPGCGHSEGQGHSSSSLLQ